MTNNNKIFIYGTEILFALGISFGSQSLCVENVHKWAVVIARYTAHILIIKGFHESCTLGYSVFQKKDKPSPNTVWKRCKLYVFLLAACVAYMVYHQQSVLGEDFLLFYIAYLVAKYPEMEQKYPMVNYGMGMAYSFYEGYLAHIMPGDGMDCGGFRDKIDKFEQGQGVVFPVKRLFLVITRSLYCPPDLKEFNKTNSDLPYLEACKSLEDVEKDVAGVKNRTYRNSAYAIYRPNKRPVYLAVECATPLHTLYRVLQKKSIYKELTNVDPAELVRDFCCTLRSIVKKNPESRDKCELVFYDDQDDSQNLADILLDKIRELEPNFESIISRRE